MHSAAHPVGPTVLEIEVDHPGPIVDPDSAEPWRLVPVRAMGGKRLDSAASQVVLSSRARLDHIPLPADYETYIKNGKGDVLRKLCRLDGYLYKIPERFKINEKWVRL
jgi:hypothetical protein